MHQHSVITQLPHLNLPPASTGSGTNPQEVFYPYNPTNLSSDALINQGGAFVLMSHGSQAWCRWGPHMTAPLCPRTLRASWAVNIVS
jgi:hypothetical protein